MHGFSHRETKQSEKLDHQRQQRHNTKSNPLVSQRQGNRGPERQSRAAVRRPVEGQGPFALWLCRRETKCSVPTARPLHEVKPIHGPEEAPLNGIQEVGCMLNLG